jgi:thiol:disulfide interchange protein DsbD
MRTVLLIAAILFGAGCADRGTGSGPHIRVRLVADQQSTSAGAAFTLGVVFKPDPGWHIYWKNPGDSGLPPRFTWKTSPGVQIKEPIWPHPNLIPAGPLTTYGYASGEVLIPFPATLNSALKSHSAHAELSLEWLVCREECLPGSANLAISLPVTDRPGAASEEAPLFEKAFASAPRELDKVSIAIEEQDDRIVVALIPLEARFLPSSATFFPEDPRIVSNSGPHLSKKEGGVLTLTLTRDRNRKEPINRLRGVLVSEQGWSPSGAPLAVQLDTNPEKNGAPEFATSQQPLATGESATEIGLLTALAFALIGGFILNLMPCVFPVLSIKVLSFMEHAQHDKSKVQMHGLLFSVGVIVSFWILAAIMLALRAGGQQLGWGFQLQSPHFIASMIVVFFALGVIFLSDFAVGQAIQSLAGGMNLPTSYLGSFLNGALATAVATPCTAPFMSTSLAATLTLPAHLGFLIFTALGVGMSAPYLILSFRPSLLQLLPRPGLWMESFKQLMAFPLLITAVWLLRIFARQMGASLSALAPLMDVLWAIVALSFGLWLLMRAAHCKQQTMRTLMRIIAVAACTATVLFTLRAASLPITQTLNEGEAVTDAYGLSWEPYSEAKVAELASAGRSIYLDFTADWCITCHANKLVVFSSQEVRNLLEQKKVALLRADWTAQNKSITEALAKYGRNGVPLNVLIPNGNRQNALILPSILTAGLIQENLVKLK